MTVPVSLDDLRASMTPEQRARVARLSAEFAREEREWLEASRDRFELYRDDVGDFRFRLVAANGAVMMTSGAFGSKDRAIRAIADIRRSAADADVVDAAA